MTAHDRAEVSNVRRERLKRVSVTIRRQSEHTRWRPRIERGPGFGMWAFGVFFVSWDTELVGPLPFDETEPF